MTNLFSNARNKVHIFFDEIGKVEGENELARSKRMITEPMVTGHFGSVGDNFVRHFFIYKEKQ